MEIVVDHSYLVPSRIGLGSRFLVMIPVLFVNYIGIGKTLLFDSANSFRNLFSKTYCEGVGFQYNFRNCIILY